MIATGGLGSVKESSTLKISDDEDVMALGLDRGSELVMLQLLAVERGVDERLRAIEGRLQSLEERVRGGVEDDDEMYEDWNGLSS